MCAKPIEKQYKLAYEYLENLDVNDKIVLDIHDYQVKMLVTHGIEMAVILGI